MSVEDVLVVDRRGLARKLARRPKSFVIYELLQNAWDEDVTEVRVEITPVPSRPLVEITVEDDSPNGFADLTSVYTLFRDSKKAPDPTKRGRFELGEKLILALAVSARITSTRGTILIEGDQRRRTRTKRHRGTVFQGKFRMTREEYEEVLREVAMLIVPDGIRTSFNGKYLESRKPEHVFETTLQTIRTDNEGNLRVTARKTEVHVYSVRPGETASIYEMGIPVVETGDQWHYDVQQRVPVNWERNNVPPSYLRTLRVATLNALHDRLDDEQTTATWVTSAIEDERCEPEALNRVLDERYGDRRVAFDPSDPEANKIAASHGYTVIHGGSLSRGTWNNVRTHGAAPAAGQVTPSPRPYDPNGKPEKVKPREEWTLDMARRVEFARRLFRELTGEDLRVYIVAEPRVSWVANFGHRQLCLNYGRLGATWFGLPHRHERVLDLLLHEFVHHTVLDHLSHEMHETATRLGAQLANIALDKPSLFDDVDAWESIPR